MPSDAAGTNPAAVSETDTREDHRSGTGVRADQTSEFNRRGLRVLVVAHLGMAVTISPAFIGVFSLFLTPMATSLSVGRSTVALAVSIVTVGGVALTPVAGWLVDRWGPRTVTLLGALSMPSGLALFAWQAQSQVGLILGSVALGVAAGFASPVAYMRVVTLWFARRLGLAIALVAGALGLGAVVNTAIAAPLIQLYGWRTAWLLLAVWVALIAISAHLLMPWRATGQRQRTVDASDVAGPARTPISRDRASDRLDATVSPGATSTAFWAAPSFWVMVAAFFFGLLAIGGMNINLASHVTDVGLGAVAAATAVSVVGACSLVARLFGGILLDYFPARILTPAIFGLQALGCVFLATADGLVGVLAGAAMVSFAYGVEADVLPYLLRRKFDSRFFGRTYGVAFGVAQLGVVLGPPLVALAHDRLGSYTAGFAGLAVGAAIASLLAAIGTRGIPAPLIASPSVPGKNAG